MHSQDVFHLSTQLVLKLIWYQILYDLVGILIGWKKRGGYRVSTSESGIAANVKIFKRRSLCAPEAGSAKGWKRQKAGIVIGWQLQRLNEPHTENANGIWQPWFPVMRYVVISYYMSSCTLGIYVLAKWGVNPPPFNRLYLLSPLYYRAPYAYIVVPIS